MKQLGLGELEIEAHPVHLLLELFALFGAIFEILHIAKPSDLKHGERQPWNHIVSPPGLEFTREVRGPVIALELHTVDKHRPDMARQRPYSFLNSVRHVVKILPHGLGVHVVKDRSGRSWSPVDNAGERFELDHGVKLPLAFRNINLQNSILDLARKIHGILQPVHRVRSKADRQ